LFDRWGAERRVKSEAHWLEPKQMRKFFYVYILESEVAAERFYTGLTDDLPLRLKIHNAGRVLHTAKWKPWRLKTYVAFSNRLRAAQFERYLKSSSHRAFIKKHF
jgi:putative endonuclease